MTRYAVPPPHRPVSLFITPFSLESVGAARIGTSSASGSAAWPSANLAMYVPFVIPDRTSFAAVRAFVFNGATASGNFDVGVYNESFSLLFSTGSTAQSGTQAPQAVTVATTLAPGRYYLGLAFDNNIATVHGTASHVAGTLTALGVLQQASAFPLPSTATPATCTQTFLPGFGISRRTLV